MKPHDRKRNQLNMIAFAFNMKFQRSSRRQFRSVNICWYPLTGWNSSPSMDLWPISNFSSIHKMKLDAKQGSRVSWLAQISSGYIGAAHQRVLLCWNRSTSSINLAYLCVLPKVKLTVSFSWLPPVPTSYLGGAQRIGALNECLGVRNVFPSAASGQLRLLTLSNMSRFQKRVARFFATKLAAEV